MWIDISGKNPFKNNGSIRIWMLVNICTVLEATRSYKLMYTRESTQQYSTHTARTSIECSLICFDENQPNCRAFRFYEKSGGDNRCLLFDTLIHDLITSHWTAGAEFIYLLKPPAVVKDCHEVYTYHVRTPGVYKIEPIGYSQFEAWCDFDDLHGWTVLQRRVDGSVDFFRHWADYRQGFGDVSDEHWLGNENIYALTRSNQILNIYLVKGNGDSASANYSSFYIENEANNYTLSISGYSGDANDAMANHNGMQFSTRDVDNDLWDGVDCATTKTGAWWYNACLHSNLNGLWTSSAAATARNIMWVGAWSGGWDVSMHQTVMRVTRQ